MFKLDSVVDSLHDDYIFIQSQIKSKSMFVSMKNIGREIRIHVFEVGKATIYVSVCDSLV